ncbi:LuxR C-terminal-related transcriptional regulator [Microbacterium sp. X-17]|uniref:helix-turn-helix transcriptional regulator n=1 Tax=Microbacterium sp. X-17 TaxID=3144404 RepID=UPI0031F58BDA
MRELGRAGTLRRAMEAVDGTREPALLLQGPSGSGKSYLLREAGRRTAMRTVLVAARPTEESWPLSGIGSIATAVAGEPYAVTAREPLSLAAEAIHDIATHMLEFLRGRDVGATTVLIDDVDRFDPQSRAVLGYLSTRLGGSGLHVLGTVEHVGEDDPLSGFPICDIPPLDAEEAADLVRNAPVSADAVTASILFWQSGGNPGALTTSLESLTPEERFGQASLPLPLPPLGPADEIAAAATEGLRDDARELLRALAAAPLTPRSVLAESAAEADSLADLFQLRLVEEVDSYVRVRNPLVRASVYGSLSARERRELHALLRLRVYDVDEALAVWHGSWADPQAVWGPALLSAAARLMRADLRGAAIEFAERGMSGPGNGSLAVRALEFAGTLVDAGHLMAAGRYIARIDRESLPPSEQLPFALARLVSDVARNGRVSLSEVDAAAAVHAEVDPDGAVSLWSVSALLHALVDDLRTAEVALDGGGVYLDRVGPTARGLHLGVRELIGATTGGHCSPIEPQTLRELARHSTEELIARGRARSVSGDTEGAARIFSLVIDLPVPVEPLWRTLAIVLSADNALRAGDLGAASSAVQQLRRGALPQLLRPLAQLVGLRVDLVVDDLDGAVDRLREWTNIRGCSPVALAAGHVVLGEHALMRGDLHTALRELQYADGLGAPLASPAMLRHHPALIEALTAIGDEVGARSALETLESAGRSMPHPWTQRAVLVGRALVARGEESRRLFDAAAHAAASADPGYESAMLLVRRARRLRALGAVDLEFAALQARTSLERVGARGWARLFEHSVTVAPAPVSPTLLDELTIEERSVVELVLQGMQNKEIAARLFISLRTVELRLTHIYRKTGARSRSHLVSLVA